MNLRKIRGQEEDQSKEERVKRVDKVVVFTTNQ